MGITHQCFVQSKMQKITMIYFLVVGWVTILMTVPKRISSPTTRGKDRVRGSGLPVPGLAGRVGTLAGAGAYSAKGRRGTSLGMVNDGRRVVPVAVATGARVGGPWRIPLDGDDGVPSPVGAGSRVGGRENSCAAVIAGGAGPNRAGGGAGRVGGNALSGSNSPADACSLMRRRSCRCSPDRTPRRPFLAEVYRA